MNDMNRSIVRKIYSGSIGQSGVLMLLAVVMTSVLLIAGIIIATLAIREARLASSSDRALISYYGAETALEESVYRIMKAGEDPLSLDGAQGNFADDGEWELTAYDTSNEFVVDYLPAGASEELDLYNRDNPASSAGVSSLLFEWTSGSQLQVDVYAWDGVALNPASQITHSCGGTGCTASQALNPSLAYAITLSATGTAITDLVITAVGASVQTPITVIANSEYRGARQSLRMILPEPAPWEGGGPSSTCGNGSVEGSETCDDANTVSGDGCSAVCQMETVCGNNAIEAGEQCDDGNTVSGDGCSASCTSESATCGNGLVEFGETCDDSDSTNAGSCNATCTAFTFCGDGTIQDPNGDNISEACDDGNAVSGDGCSSACVSETGVCGNGVIEFGETCDDGAGNSDSAPDACRTNCQIAFCGDNVIDTGEQCDGTSFSVGAGYSSFVTDACSSSCTYNICFTANFHPTTAFMNVSSAYYPQSWSWYVQTFLPVVNGVTYSNVTTISPITGICYNHCSNVTIHSSDAVVVSNRWRASLIATWPAPINVSPTPVIGYSGVLRFCAP